MIEVVSLLGYVLNIRLDRNTSVLYFSYSLSSSF